MRRSAPTLTRTDRIPTGYVLAERDEALGVLVMTSPNQLDVIAFAGRSDKPAFYISFKTVERARSYTSEWVAGVVKRASDRKAERDAKSGPHSLQLDDVLSASWGYDQTNVDFYQVTAVVTDKTVELRKIAAERVEKGGHMAGECVPLVGVFTGEPFRARPTTENCIKIGGHTRASPHDYKEVAGVRIYRAAYYSTCA
ncbi:hypothetical protein [Pseudomonas syringae pv. coryli]|uniref:hypothetical protein n=1 Tax=Pseudomonas syringae pv. coryli TaxID=317659 RepID=UPI003D2B1CEB